MNEVECMINENGVIIFVKDFLPFTLSAVKETTPSTTKKILSITGEGGSVDNSLSSLVEGASVTFTYTPKEDYEIDYILLNGERQIVSGNSLTITYETLSQKNNYLEAYFIATIAKQNEGESSPIIPEAEVPSVSIHYDSNKKEIISNVSGNLGYISYRWYKGDQSTDTTELSYKLSEGESGSYKLIVTNTVLRSSRLKESNIINVNSSDDKEEGNNYKFPGWAIVLIIILCVGIIGGVIFIIYKLKFSPKAIERAEHERVYSMENKSKENQPEKVVQSTDERVYEKKN